MDQQQITSFLHALSARQANERLMQASRVVSVCSFICIGGQVEDGKHSSCSLGGE